MDARRLAPEAQEDLRRRVVYAMRFEKMKQKDVAEMFGVSRQSVKAWTERAVDHGEASLAAQKRGPKVGENRLLGERAEREIVRLIRGKCPDQLLLPFALWTREAVIGLIKQRGGISVSLSTSGRYLRRWGFTPQKPMRRAYERDPAAVKAWLSEEYPAIERRAKSENALILWGDEMGLRSDDQIGRSYAPRGQTPVVPATGRRFGCSMISAISNLGQLWFMVFHVRFDARLFIEFLSRLLRAVEKDRKIFLIVDGHPAHKAAKVKRWLTDPAFARADRLELLYLPGYSPDLNPDECLNQDTKQAMRKQRPHDRNELMSNVRGHLRRRQKQPGVVKRFFKAPGVQYAAA